MLERIRNDSKARTLGAIRVGDKRRSMASCHVRTAASTSEKERVFAAKKCVYITITLSVEDRRVSPAMHQHW